MPNARCLLNMKAHFKTDTTPFTNSLLLLVMVAGVLNIDLFESDAVSGYNNHKGLYRIEVVFNAEHPIPSAILSVSRDTPVNDVVKDCVVPRQFYPAYFGTALSVIQNKGQVKTRRFHFSHHTSSFNIPHQNSDEDDAFILSVDVA
jgi:hypothetical protein